MHAALSFRQERFVFEYLKDQNAAAAAGRAGYTAANLASQGNELLKNPAVRDRVRVELESLLAELHCSALELIRQRARAAFFDPGKLLDGWAPVPLDALEEGTRAVLEVSSVMRRSGPVVRVKQACRHRALRALERVHERLQKAQAAALDRAERLGQLTTLEELEEMEREEDALQEAERAGRLERERAGTAGQVCEKPQVSSGGAPAEVAEAGEKPRVSSGGEPDGGAGMGGKPRVFSGEALGGAGRPGVICEKPQGLSGAVRARTAGFDEKTHVLSGAAVPRGSGGADFSRKHRVLSGGGVPVPPAPLSQATLARAMAALWETPEPVPA